MYWMAVLCLTAIKLTMADLQAASNALLVGNWSQALQWNSSIPVCQWVGITCTDDQTDVAAM